MKPLLLVVALLVQLTLPITLPAHAQVVGGPIIDAAVYGNMEFYPGQTAPLFVVVQNKGYINALSGFQSTEAQFSLGTQNSFTGDLDTATKSTSQSATSDATSKISSSNGLSSSSFASEPITNGTSSIFSNQSSGFEADSSSSLSESASQNTDSTIFSTDNNFNSNIHLIGTTGGVQENTMSSVPMDATTALGLACQLTPGDAPLEIVTGDTGIVGSLAQGQVGGGPNTLYTLSFGLYQPLQFWIRVDLNATPGDYTLPLVCTYKYLVDDYRVASASGPVLENKNYAERTVTIPLHIVIMRRFDLAITNVDSREMVPDTNGYITMTVQNLGNLSVTGAVAFLAQPKLGTPQDAVSSNYPLSYELSSFLATTFQQPQSVDQPMVVPLQNSQYLGDMAPGDSRNVTFKVSISKDAEESDIPLTTVVSYRDPWDQLKSSNVVTFGAHVEKEMIFEANAEPVQITMGGSTVANLTLTNTGSETAHNAIARMNALDPFTVSYDTVYLGDVAPGQTVPARFGIKVRSDAVSTLYYVTMEVKYYDSHHDPHVTKVITQAIDVLPPPTIWDLLMQYWWLILLLALAILLGLAYFGYSRLKKGRKPPATGKPPGSAETPESAGKPLEAKDTTESARKQSESTETPDLRKYPDLLASNLNMLKNRLNLRGLAELLKSRLNLRIRPRKEKSNPAPIVKRFANKNKRNHSSINSLTIAGLAPSVTYYPDGSGGTRELSAENKEQSIPDSEKSDENIESDYSSANNHTAFDPEHSASFPPPDPGPAPNLGTRIRFQTHSR